MGCRQVVRQQTLTLLYVGSIPTASVFNIIVMTVNIQFLKGINETTLPLIFLTRSQNGQTGTASFFFKNPTLFSHYNAFSEKIENMHLIWENNEIKTNNIKIHFYEGQPFLIESIFIFTSNKEWFTFFSFMNYYSKERGLFYDEKQEKFK